MPRPIEVHAHDPLRYVGDMLGWLHQVCDHIFFSYAPSLNPHATDVRIAVCLLHSTIHIAY